MFPVSFKDAVRALGPDATFRLANGVRPPSRYLFQTLLPDRNMFTYHVEDANMTVRTTAAGMSAMDANYAEVGVMEGSTFQEGTIKITSAFNMTEEMLRAVQELMRNLMLGGGNVLDALVRETLNVEQKLIIQSIWDRMEWLRAKALVTGAISWTFGDKAVSIDYGVPDANFLANETGNDTWDGSSSDFWDNWTTGLGLLNYDLRAAIAHPTTITKIIGNTANNVTVDGSNWLNGEPVTLQRMDTIGGVRVPYPDGRYKITLIPYGEEMEIFDLTTPGRTTKIPFMPTGKILMLGNNRRTDYRVGEGATDDPDKDLPLGYTHIAPTTEANGAPGIWSQFYVPEDMPMQLRARGAANVLPVIQAPEKIVVLSSNLS